MKSASRTLALPFLLLAACRGLPAEDTFLLIEGGTLVAGDPGAPDIIEGGTVLVRGGLIQAVGRDPELPDDVYLARRLDASGLIIHPAFIDALTASGVTSRGGTSRNRGRDPDPREGPIVRSLEARRTGIFPERQALEAWNPSRANLQKLRRLGFGAALIVEEGGCLPGAGALVSLAGGPIRDRVIEPRIAQRMVFARSRRSYPRSLMGVIAHLRQTFLDARHYRDLVDLYRERPRGTPRPPHDTALAALAAVIRGDLPVLLAADTENDVRRGWRLADELGFDLVITGGREAYRAADELKTRGTPVVLVPDAPERPKLQGGEGALPARVQRHRIEEWERQVGGAATLAKAGVRFAYGSGAGADPERLLKNVRLHIEHGLGEEAALRALTLGAAEILGVEDVLGSIEPGKTANLILRAQEEQDDGDEDDDDDDDGNEGFRLLGESRVRYTVIDGVLFDHGEPEKKDGGEEEPAEATEKDKPEAKEKPEEREKEKPEGKDEPQDLPALPAELDEDRRPTLVTGGRVLIRSATVITCTGRDLPETDVRVAGGKIEAIGEGLEPLEDMKVLDARGWHLMPGIVDCHSHLAIDGGVNEATLSITAEVRVRDVVDPQDLALYRALAGGVTTSNLLHGSANAIGGQNCVIRHRYRSRPEELFFPDAPPGIKFALGENPRRSNSPARGRRFPMSRMGVEAVLRRTFEEAAEYRRRAEAAAEALVRGERPTPLRRDLRLEALLEVLEGRRWVHTHCYRSDEILMMLDVARDYGLELATLQHVLEGYKVAPEIAAAGVGASTFSDWWAYKLEAYDAIPHNAAIMTRAGVLVSINSDDPEMVRRLNQEAAKMVRSGGLSHEEALRLITRNPAEQLGIDDRVGTIEIGKDADLAIFDAHPLSIYARCRYTLIGGEVLFERRDEVRHPRHRSGPLPPRSAEFEDPPAENPRGVYALAGGRIITVGGPVIEAGTVVIEDGRIAAVGKRGETAVPEGATVVDVSGLRVYPGFIDAGSRLGIREISSVAGSVDSRETGEAQPDLVTATAVHAHSELIPVARAGGVTSTVVFFSGPVLSGQASWIGLRGRTTEELVRTPRAALHVVVPGVRREDEKPPEEVETLAEWFRRARDYARGQEEARRRNGPPPPSRPRLEALKPYAARELPVVFSADTEPSIRLAIDLADRLDVRAILRGGRDAWKVADLLAEKGIPVIVGPVHALPTERFDPYDAPFANPGRLAAAGVPIAFQTRHAALVRNLPYQAGTAVAHGLPHDAAIEALTLGAARILGVDGRVGSIESGKLADVIVTTGDPLEPTSHVVYVFVGGRPVSLESRHTRLARRFLERLREAGGRRRKL